MKGFPTSADIYLELDGRKIAVVQSYRAKAAKSSKNIEAFGESEPVATIEGQKSYTVELTRLYATDTAISDGIDFYNLTDFSLVICKPDRKVIYSGCEWSGIQEDGELNATVAERVTLTAAPAHRDYRMRTVDALKPLTAGELLELWRYYRERVEDPLERTLLCNAAILRDSCYCQGEAIYGDELEVLRDLTPGEMEDLLLRLAEGEALPEERGGTFDLQRFADMKGE